MTERMSSETYLVALDRALKWIDAQSSCAHPLEVMQDFLEELEPRLFEKSLLRVYVEDLARRMNWTDDHALAVARALVRVRNSTIWAEKCVRALAERGAAKDGPDWQDVLADLGKED